MSAAVKILDWRPVRRNSLLGFARAELPSGMIVADVTILTGARGPWASPSSKAMIGSDGAALRDAAGKIRYVPIIEFATTEIRSRFSAAVVEAVSAAFPEAMT